MFSSEFSTMKMDHVFLPVDQYILLKAEQRTIKYSIKPLMCNLYLFKLCQ